MFPRGATKKKNTKEKYKEELNWPHSLQGKRGGKGKLLMTFNRPKPVTVRRASVRWRGKISRRQGRRHSIRSEGGADLLEAINMNNL